jgi:hypothetical protein
MPVRSATPPATDVVGLALKILAAQGLTRPAAHAALAAVAGPMG